MDDVLDFEQSSETLGKPALNDLKQGIATAPVLFAAQVSLLSNDLLASQGNQRSHQTLILSASIMDEHRIIRR